VTSPDGVALQYGKTYEITASGDSVDPDARVAIIRFGSTTHGNNMDQRYVWLDTSERTRTTESGNVWRLTVQVPANPAAAPPGDYMLVVVDGAGVPSVAKLARLAQHPGTLKDSTTDQPTSPATHTEHDHA
jgi:hypothetical protein